MNNAVATPAQNTNIHFNETQWLQALFLLADTQSWLQQLQEGLIWQLPVKHRKKLLRKGSYLSSKALAHILERHYYKVPRHPLTGKFTIPIPQIVACIRDACQQPPQLIPCSPHLQRVLDTGTPLGHDTSGNTVTTITVITSTGGEIITAFPGILLPPQDL
ncbi:hypothetical protein DC498_11705 [Terrimonas sp.]|uniref:hypothetical protein n=1 Tax=Terrimonas sp. TaxID=1914338 RepID=UPI000D51E87E|nr:hypothetical protein [Terrimonas sp.]PVD52048.1 hypothetical protein DC498_11705 [Terrimonas sp.]